MCPAAGGQADRFSDGLVTDMAKNDSIRSGRNLRDHIKAAQVRATPDQGLFQKNIDPD